MNTEIPKKYSTTIPNVTFEISQKEVIKLLNAW